MPNGLLAISTRFRAYQLGQAGSSFSYMAGNHFTLIEAVATEASRESIKHELDLCGRTTIDTLHVTSWDADHCSASDLQWILENFHPRRIEYPGYEPHSDGSKEAKQIILRYKERHATTSRPITLQRVDPSYVHSLNPAEGLGYKDVVYHPKELVERSNDNSTVKFFRAGMFNVLSLGDVENANIGAMLRRCKILCRETDIMILAHHGADGGITTRKFVNYIDPLLGICASNHGNQYEHPAPEVRALFDNDRPLYTTKRGDVVIRSMEPHTKRFEVIDLEAGSTKEASRRVFVARKSRLLSANTDAIRNTYRPGFKGIRRV
jgi:competence protein ComEC